MNLDAYTVRKLAPKLLIAVVAVNISIYLCVAAIDITNVFGRGINQLITAPFHQAAQDKFQLDTLQGGDDTLVFFGITIAVGILLTLSLAGGQLLPMIALVLFPIVLAVLAVLVTLVIRKALLVILTIVSPIAFALWVLPGTDKYFKQWWSLFLKTLMVYPIVAALFAVTNIMAVVTFNSGQISREEVIAAGEIDPGQAGGAGVDGFGDNALNAIIGIILVFIPLFMIPFAFKFAGGAIGSISGQLSDMQKPFSRLAGRSRQKRLESNVQRAQAGGLFNTEKSGRRDRHAGYLGSRAQGKSRRAAAVSAARRATTRPNFGDLNKKAQSIASLKDLGLNPRRFRERTRLARQGLRNTMAKDIMENSPDYKNIAAEEGILKAMQVRGGRKQVTDEFRKQVGGSGYYFNNDGSLKQTGQDLVTGAMNVRRNYGYDAAAQAGILGTVDTGPAYSTSLQAGGIDPATGEYHESSTEKFAKSIVDVSNGDIGTAFNLLGEGLGRAGQKGRVDFLGSSSKAGAAIEAGVAHGTDSEQFRKAMRSWEKSTWTNKSPSGLINAHKSSQPQIMRYMDDDAVHIDNGIASGNRTTMDLVDDATGETVSQIDEQVMQSALLSGVQQNIDGWSPEGRQGFKRTYMDSKHKFEVINNEGNREVLDLNYQDMAKAFQRGVIPDAANPRNQDGSTNIRYRVPPELKAQYDALHRHWGVDEAGAAQAAAAAAPPDA